MDPFTTRLMSISQHLTTEDLDKMKFVLQHGSLPKGKLQNVQKPYELFNLMIEAELLSEDKLSCLAELLKSAGRMDLSKDLPSLPQEQVEGEVVL